MTDDDTKDAEDQAFIRATTEPGVRIEVFGPGTVVLNRETGEYFFVPAKH